MIEINAIHLSQLPDTWEAIGTYSSTMHYQHIPNNFNYQDCMEWLMRKIKQLDAKIEQGGYTRHMTRWQNQRDMYQAIFKYLSLRKQV